MTHRELELQLDAYVDGELAPAEARELEAHLKECGECARLHEARVALSAAIRLCSSEVRSAESGTVATHQP